MALGTQVWVLTVSYCDSCCCYLFTWRPVTASFQFARFCATLQSCPAIYALSWPASCQHIPQLSLTPQYYPLSMPLGHSSNAIRPCCRTNSKVRQSCHIFSSLSTSAFSWQQHRRHLNCISAYINLSAWGLTTPKVLLVQNRCKSQSKLRLRSCRKGLGLSQTIW